MSPADVVHSLRRRGIVLVPAAGRILYHPRDALSDAERASLTRHRDAVLTILDSDPVGWRTAVLRSQVRRTGAIPLLLARPGMRFPVGTCCSCGDALEVSDRYRCRACVEAVVTVLEARP